MALDERSTLRDGHERMRELGGLLIVLGFVAMAPAIVLNSVLLMRFTRVYTLYIGEPMPSLAFDLRGRWLTALTTRATDPTVERLRVQVRWSQAALGAPFGLAFLGVLLVVWR